MALLRGSVLVDMGVLQLVAGIRAEESGEGLGLPPVPSRDEGVLVQIGVLPRGRGQAALAADTALWSVDTGAMDLVSCRGVAGA